MQLTVHIKLRPNPFQTEALRRTVTTVNAACDSISAEAFAAREFRRFSLHKLTYHSTREKFALEANVTCLAIAKVASSYKLNQREQHTFRPLGAVTYNSRCLSWKNDAVSIWTIGKRMHVPFVMNEVQRSLLNGKRGESKLTLRDGEFYLHVACKAECAPKQKTEEFLGVDLGIVNIAADSNGKLYSGKRLNGLRRRHSCLRSRLQKKRTKSAKRLLVKRRRKESRFARDVNHCISKQIVETAEGTGRGIALEDLRGIRGRVTARKSGRRQLHAWSFFQLRFFIEYKAQLKGLPVVLVDPKNTSRTCPECGYCDKRNRKSQAEFVCRSCDHSSNADLIAAINIGRRAVIPRPYAEQAVAC